MRDLLLSIHVIAIALWFGGAVMIGLLNMGVMKAGRVDAQAVLARVESGLGLKWFMPMAVTTLVTGILLIVAVDGSPYEFSDLFVSVGFLAIIVSAILGPTKFEPLGRKIADSIEAGDQAAAEAAAKEIRMWSISQEILLLVTIVLMVVKPGV